MRGQIIPQIARKGNLRRIHMTAWVTTFETLRELREQAILRLHQAATR
jgi:hypothetical protein